MQRESTNLPRRNSKTYHNKVTMKRTRNFLGNGHWLLWIHTKKCARQRRNVTPNAREVALIANRAENLTPQTPTPAVYQLQKYPSTDDALNHANARIVAQHENLRTLKTRARYFIQSEPDGVRFAIVNEFGDEIIARRVVSVEAAQKGLFRLQWRKFGL